MSKNLGQKAAGLAQHIVAIRNIIRAFAQGGWAAAALQALKHYWPQILCIACCVTLICLIITCAIPMMMFGFTGSGDAEINAMNEQAGNVAAYFNNYDKYCLDRTEEINTEIEDLEDNGYKVVQVGYYMPKNWFIALFSVSVGNDLTGVTEQQVIDFLDNCIVYEVLPIEEQTTEPGEAAEDKIIIYRHTPEQAMDYMNFSEADRDWASLLYDTLEKEETNGIISTNSNQLYRCWKTARYV